MIYISFPGTAEWIFIGMVLIYWAVIVGRVYSLIKMENIDLGTKMLWIIILLAFPFVGLFLYNCFSTLPSR